MRLRLRFALLGLASLLLLQIAAAQSDASACAENCRFVVVPSLGPAGPVGPAGADGKDGLNSTLDTSITYQKLKISDAELTGVTSANRAVIGPDAPTVCRGNTSETRLTLTIGRFGFAQIGSMIKWADGSVSILVDAVTPLQQSGTQGRINDEAVREEMDCLFYSSRFGFVSSNAYTKDGVSLVATATTSMGQPVIHHDLPNGARVVKLSLELMNQRNKAVWSFPAPPNVGVDTAYNDTFVGRDMVQTLSNKTLQSPATTGQLSMTGNSAKLSFGPTYANCVGNQTADDLVIETSCSVGYASIGDVIEWGDGTVANIVDVAPVNGDGQSWSMTLVRDGGPANRISAPFKLYSARAPNPNNAATQLSPMVTALGGRLVLRGGLSGYGGSSAVSINMFKMDSRNDRHHARWSFPYPGSKSDTSYHLFVGEQTAQTVSNKVIKASETNGHFRLTKYASLGIGGSISESAASGSSNPGYTMINATINGNLLTTDKSTFWTSHIGCVIEWADGVNAVVQIVGPQQGEEAALTATITAPFVIPRDWQMVKLWLGNTILSSSFAMFQDKIALKARIGGASGRSSAVTIDVAKMRVDAGVRHQTSWTFPHPGPAGQQNYFVGEQTVQTLSNKILDAAKCNNGLTISSGGLTVTTGGLTVMNGGLAVTHGMTAATLTLKTSLTFENGWLNAPAAGLNVAGGPLIPERLRVTGVTELWDTLAIKAGGIEAPSEGLSITGGGVTVTGGLQVDRIAGKPGGVHLAIGTGTGTGGYAKILDNSQSNHIAGTIQVTVGSTAVTNQILVIVIFDNPAPVVGGGRCFVTLHAANPLAATLPSDKQVYVNGLYSAADRFQIWMVNPLPVGEYLWNYHVIC